jgi:hypothetical protein
VRLAGLLLAALICACGGPGSNSALVTTSPAALATSTPSAAASPTVSASSAASPTSAVDFSCRLPVLWFGQDPGADGKTGFVDFPAATVDASTSTPPAPEQFSIGVSYDHAVGRWLPVSGEAVAPDGLHYAYAEYDPPGPNDGKAAIGTTGRVHVVDARTGADHVIYSGSPTWTVVDFSAQGIYLSKANSGSYTIWSSGLYLMSATGGTPAVISVSDVNLERGGWSLVSGGAAWGVAFTDTLGIGSGNELLRLDLANGRVESWLSVPDDHILALLGLDAAGMPIVVSELASITEGQSPQAELLSLEGPNLTRTISGPDDGSFGEGVLDGHGFWMGSGDGAAWIYKPASGLVRFPLFTGNTNVMVAGACA